MAGSVTVKSGNTASASSSAQATLLVLTVPQGYYSGASSVTVSTSSTNFVANNIATGTNLFGVTGTAYPSKPLRTGQGTSDYCINASGNSISCTGTGEDGQYHAGQAATYTDNGNGTITANATGLMWQKCAVGKAGSDCSGGSETPYNFVTATSTCAALNLGGYSGDWRVPNINELLTLVDYSATSGGNGNGDNQATNINRTYFPHAPNAIYWSSTPWRVLSMMLSVSFNFQSSGQVIYPIDITISNYIRCVRGGL